MMSLSVCCAAPLQVASSAEGTSFHVCTGCGLPADAADETRGFALRYAAGVRKSMTVGADEQPTSEAPSRGQSV